VTVPAATGPARTGRRTPTPDADHLAGLAVRAGLEPDLSGLRYELDHLTQHSILRVPVAPDDVAPDQEGLGLVALVVRAVETEVAQRGELGLDAVEPAGGVREWRIPEGLSRSRT